MARIPRQRRDELLVVALAKGESNVIAAKLGGCSLRTVDRRLADPTFRDEVQKVRSRLVATAAGRIAGLMDSAADALRELLNSQTEAIRLSAARAVFDVALKLKECAELEDRLLAVEEKLNVSTSSAHAGGTLRLSQSS